MQSRLLLDIIIRKSTTILQLLPRKDQALLIRRNTLLILNLRLHIVDGVRGLDFESDGLPRQGLDEDLHTSTKTKDQVKSRLLLDVIVGESTAVLELFTGEDQALLIRGDAFLILDLGLHVVDGVGRLNLEGDSLARQGLDKDLHATAKTKDKMEGGLFLDIVVGERTPVLELFASEDKALLIGRDSFLVLNLGLNVVDRITRLDFERDRLSGERLNEDLHCDRYMRGLERFG